MSVMAAYSAVDITEYRTSLLKEVDKDTVLQTYIQVAHGRCLSISRRVLNTFRKNP